MKNAGAILFLVLFLVGCTEQFKYDRAKMLFDKTDVRNKNGFKGDLQEALSQINEVVEMNDTNALAWELRGEINSSLENYSAAESDFSNALKSKPTWADTYLMRGMTEFQLKKYPAVVRDADAALANHLSNEHVGVAWYWKGKAHGELEDRKTACEDFKMAKEKGYPVSDADMEKYCK